MLVCRCEDHKENMEMIAGMQAFCALQPAAPKWVKDKHKIFKYCPWCATELKEEEIE